MRRSSALQSAGLAIALAIGPANAVLSAHDFWIEPAAFETRAGSPVAIRLRVGEGLVGQPVPRAHGRIERFSAVGPAGEQAIEGPDGVDPAGVWRPIAEGPTWIVYRSRPHPHRAPAETFERYLVEEGLDVARALRAERQETGSPGRERFSRCAKALLHVGVGDAGAALVREPVGLPLELVPAIDPSRLAPDDELPVRLLFRGRPLAGAQVVAIPAADTSRSVVRRTDSSGRALLPLDRTGLWLVKAVWIEALAGVEEADWESWWASLTFAIPAVAPAARERPQGPGIGSELAGRQ